MGIILLLLSSIFLSFAPQVAQSSSISIISFRTLPDLVILGHNFTYVIRVKNLDTKPIYVIPISYESFDPPESISIVEDYRPLNFIFPSKLNPYEIITIGSRALFSAKKYGEVKITVKIFWGYSEEDLGYEASETFSFMIYESQPETYTITFLTFPPDVGSITFDGSTYFNGQTGSYQAGTYSIKANVPAGYIFKEWNWGGMTNRGQPPIEFEDLEAPSTRVTIRKSGQIVALFGWFVKLRGTVVYEAVNEYGIDVKIDEILFDTSGRLRLGEIIWVYNPAWNWQPGWVKEGDKVEVYGLGTWPHDVIIEWPEHYVKKVGTDKFRVLVVFTQFPDEGNYFVETYSTRLSNFLQKLEYVIKYFYKQSYGKDTVVFKILSPILMPEPASEYHDGIPNDNSYTPNSRYLNDVWDELVERHKPLNYDGLLVVQTDFASRIHNFHTFRAAALNPTLLPSGVDAFFGLYKGNIPVAMVTFDDDAEVIAHELGHVLYEFEDYYGIEGPLGLIRSGGDVRFWCIMGGPLDEEGPEIDQPIFSLNKVKAGWLKSKVIQLGGLKSYNFEIKSLESMGFGDEVLLLYRSGGSLLHSYTIFYLLEGRETFPMDYMVPGLIKELIGIERGVVIYRRGISPLLVGGWIKVNPAFGGEWSWTLPTLSEISPTYADSATKTIFTYKGYDEKTGKFTIEVRVDPTYFADINKDGIVDYKDLAVLAASYGKSVGEPGFNPEADLNGDGLIDYKDLAILAFRYAGA